MAETWDSPNTTQELTGIEREVVAVIVDAFIAVIDDEGEAAEQMLMDRLLGLTGSDDEDEQEAFIRATLQRLRPKLN